MFFNNYMENDYGLLFFFIKYRNLQRSLSTYHFAQFDSDDIRVFFLRSYTYKTI